MTFKYESTQNVLKGFAIVVIAFTLPIAALFVFMLRFKNDSILFSKKELAGAKQISSIVTQLKTDFKIDPHHANLEKQIDSILEVSDTTNLILDPDLDTFYIMLSVTRTVPQIFKLLSKSLQNYKNPKEIKNLDGMKSVLTAALAELDRSMSISIAQDKNFYGQNNKFQENIHLLHEKFIEASKVDLNSKNNRLHEATFDVVFEHWIFLAESLESMLRERVNVLQGERINAVGFSLLAWLCSVLFTIYFSFVVVRRQTLLNKKVIVTTEALVASAKMSALGQMAGGMAHEINTPLAVIAMRVEQLEELVNEGQCQPEDIRNTLNIIRLTTERIVKIVSGLRVFARDGSSLLSQRVLILPLIEETLSFCKERFQHHGVELIVVNNSVDSELSVECRSVEISQVLINLLNNSFDAIEHLAEKWVKIEAKEQTDSIEISITDSGAGIPLDIQKQLMQPFFTTKEVGKGTGLGLSISRGIIQSHRGKLYIDSSSLNTRFVISLPKTQNAQRPDKEVA